MRRATYDEETRLFEEALYSLTPSLPKPQHFNITILFNFRSLERCIDYCLSVLENRIPHPCQLCYFVETRHGCLMPCIFRCPKRAIKRKALAILKEEDFQVETKKENLNVWL